MPAGGARNRSGPPPDPNSGRSEARGLTFIDLPPEGYHETPPPFPLPGPSYRECDVWDEVWMSPQASQWINQPWRWRFIGLWVRLSVRTEDVRCAAGVLGEVHRYADQIGLTPAGMKENGWKIGSGEVKAETQMTEGRDFMSRLRVIAPDAEIDAPLAEADGAT